MLQIEDLPKNITLLIKNIKKKLKGQSKVVIVSFSGSNITKYSGLNTVAKYMNKQGIIKSVSTFFPTEWHSATKFGVNQVLISIVLASFCRINRICKIALFTGDGLARVLLRLDKAINENAISATLKKLGQSGARKLQSFLLSKNARWLKESGLTSITLNTGSTVKLRCIACPDSSGKIIFTKPIGKSLTGSSKRHKKQRKEENMETTPRVYGRGTFY